MNLVQQKRYEHWAGMGYGSGHLISTAFQYFTHSGSFDPNRPVPVTFGQAACLSAFMLGHAYFVWKGNRWAKVLMLLFLLGGALYAMVQFREASHVGQHPISIAHNWFQWGLCAAIVGCLILSFRKTTISLTTSL